MPKEDRHDKPRRHACGRTKHGMGYCVSKLPVTNWRQKNCPSITRLPKSLHRKNIQSRGMVLAERGETMIAATA
jgi:hypothetical protein